MVSSNLLLLMFLEVKFFDLTPVIFRLDRYRRICRFTTECGWLYNSILFKFRYIHQVIQSVLERILSHSLSEYGNNSSYTCGTNSISLADKTGAFSVTATMMRALYTCYATLDTAAVGTLYTPAWYYKTFPVFYNVECYKILGAWSQGRE